MRKGEIIDIAFGISMCKAINFHVFLICREGNKYDDRLGNSGLDSRVEFAWYGRLPTCFT